MAPTWPSIIPDGATMSAPASAWAKATFWYSSRVASLSTPPVGVRTPQCPWSVYSSTQRSAMATTLSPWSSRRFFNATWTTPSGFQASDPVGSFRAGNPKRTIPGTPRPASSFTSARSESWVCCIIPGRDEMGCGSSMSSRTNKGAIKSSTPTRVSATSRRSDGVCRRRRRRR